MIMFLKKLNLMYGIIIYQKKNFYMLPTGRAGKDYLDEITRLLNAWIRDSNMKHITFKSIMELSHIIKTQSQLKSEGSFWSTPVKNDSMAIRWFITIA